MSRRLILAASCRIVSALLVSTFFQPDEYFQSLEITHGMVFGYGHLTWEWTTALPIRSPLFPALFAPVYWLLKLVGADGGELLVCA
jgi:phosphatidylinositol glycan class B